MSADVQGHCPACGSASLFLGSGGYVTCRIIGCPNPTAASDILGDGETGHIVTLGRTDFTIRHPLIERLGDTTLMCETHRYLARGEGPPVQPGRYRVLGDPASRSSWQILPALPEKGETR